ncbi:Mitochondrial presequence protease [Dimargaris verticillata]|uniref:Presequence protease, mitochondrial n=1 Tax=Dimargaris verticillata TaxID=2761393 RepID=A0A9W8EB81_9FUNG|nr:Mitochondrial presequence protease [Dimargaris verticillata]
MQYLNTRLKPVASALVHQLQGPRLLRSAPHLGATAFQRFIATQTSSTGPLAKVAQDFAPGQVVHGFKVKEIRHVDELSATAILLTHERTRAEYLHVARDDTNNVFSVGFATAPTDSTGVSHILEHTVLCGSRKYPVRDPFFKMLNRSMSTFMNAWTAHDYTQYPFATQNLQDFNNLRDVYLDAAFHPLLEPMDFYQEGWRIERQNPLDTSSPWTFKGVVYNEMKGAMSDPGSLFATKAQQALYPDGTYHHVSGGDPSYITDLTHADLVAFHRAHYHPSNARFYSYGSVALKPQLEAIDRTLAPFAPQATPTADFTNRLPDGLHRVITQGPLDTTVPENRQTKLSLTYLTNSTSDLFETFAVGFAARLLLSGVASPMHQALIDTNLGSEYAANTGYDPFCPTSSLSIGLQGVDTSEQALVEAAIRHTLETTAKEGFPTKAIESVIHLIEMSHKHKTANFGLSLMQSVSTGWFHGLNPIDLMEITKNVTQLRGELAGGPFFQTLMRKYLIDNPKQLVFTMEPNRDYNAQMAAEEEQRLVAKVSQFTPQDVAHWTDVGHDLLKAQNNEKQDLSCLPTLQLADIPLETKRVPLNHTSVQHCPVQWHVAPTNGLSYLRAINTVDHIPSDLAPYVPLFCDALTMCGTHTRSMADLERDLLLYTSGVSISHHLSPDSTNFDQVEQGISFTSHCLDANVPRMYQLIQEIVQETDFGKTDRLKTLIVGNASGLWNSIADSGHIYARTLAMADLSPLGHRANVYQGFDQLALLSQLTAQASLSDVATKLKQLSILVFNQTSLRAAVTTSDNSVSINQAQLDQFLQAYPRLSDATTTPPATDKFSPTLGRKQFAPMPFATNFSAQCFRTVPFTHDDNPKLQLLSKLMTTHFLHREIREKNGAYGGGATFSSQSGTFSFYSYRDPNPFSTVEVYRKAVDWAAQRTFDDREMTEAKLSLFSDIDAPVSLYQEGMTYFVSRITDDMRQKRRDAFMRMTSADVQEAAAKYLANPAQASTAALPSDWETKAV